MKIRKRYLFPIVLIAGYFLGPKVTYDSFDGQLPTIDISIEKLDQHIAQLNSNVINLKPRNESKIVWADSIQKTEYSIVYLHGFSASPMEGEPFHREFAKHYGFNLYIPRLAGHGIQDDDSFRELTPKDLVDSAKDAVAIGQLLGEKVILMSCSTGSTLALYLSAENPTAIHSNLMYSPNIDLHDSNSKLLTMPWGRQLTRLLLGESRSIESFKGTEMEKYWTSTYHSQGIIALKYLIENTMTRDILSKVSQPYFLAYYYKDDQHFDDVVSIDKMKWFNEIASTPKQKKQLIAIPDAGGHAMVSELQNKNLASLYNETYKFCDEILGLQPVE